MDDLNPVLTDLGLELVEEQNVSTVKLLNIKHCRVVAGPNPSGLEERALCTTHV